jgi:hypothetical protein
MEDFGVCFRIDDTSRFDRLRELFGAIKRDKDANSFRSDDEWLPLVPDSVRANFNWPTSTERRAWVDVRDRTPIAISPPADQLGAKWDFFRVIESLENGEYGLLSCEQTEIKDVCEMRIDPWAYPYGGLGPLIALVEAFGFSVLGVNLYGRYLTSNDPREGNG